ncbi:hypothetical protein AB0I39_13495 [Kitasatospora purpeofusca]|uniref:hypothetical protein n=1 Tax=Kitasatospora purpeofusca TaxID=67352 RepID=UPI0033E5EFBA
MDSRARPAVGPHQFGPVPGDRGRPAGGAGAADVPGRTLGTDGDDELFTGHDGERPVHVPAATTAEAGAGVAEGRAAAVEDGTGTTAPRTPRVDV